MANKHLFRYVMCRLMRLLLLQMATTGFITYATFCVRYKSRCDHLEQCGLMRLLLLQMVTTGFITHATFCVSYKSRCDYLE